MAHVAVVSHDCRPFLHLKAAELREKAKSHRSKGKPELALPLDATAVVLEVMAGDLPRGGYVDDAYAWLYGHEQNVLRDQGEARNEKQKVYFDLLLRAIGNARIHLVTIDVMKRTPK